MQSSKYNLSFTAASLLWLDSVKLAAIYQKARNWQAVQEYVRVNNVLQARTDSALNRTTREICQRLATLTDDEIELLIEGEPKEQKALLWVALCRRHLFIREFAVEILRERWLSFRHDLRYEDYDAFFNTKAEWDEALENTAESTRKKLRQVLFLIMRETDLLNASNMIQQALLSPRFVSVISKNSRQDLMVFPTYETDLKG